MADLVNNGGVLTNEQKSLVEEAGYNESDIVIKDSTVVYLTRNIDLGARQKNGELISGTAWIPIGKTNALKFTGTFNGNNHVVKGLYVNITENFAGLFGNSDTIKNVTIKDGYVKTSGACAGGVVAALREGSIINCNNINTQVKGMQSVGGIVGQITGEIIGCTNNGAVSQLDKDKNAQAGGIVGILLSGKVSKCINNGNIEAAGRNVGGIVGTVKEGELRSCVNSGNVNGEEQSVGGIVGQATTSGKRVLIDCINNGIVEGYSQSVGGIVGQANGGVGGSFTHCINTGLITVLENEDGLASFAGGIIGLISTDTLDPSTAETNNIKYCRNLGKVHGKAAIGGIIGGATQYGTIIEKSFNIAEIEGIYHIGGIVGELGRSSKTENCYNKGSIKGEESIGGIVGDCYASPNPAGSVVNCYNIGNVLKVEQHGGIWGTRHSSHTSVNSYYLEGTAELDYGDETAKELAKNSDYIKTTFLTNANASETIWEIRDGINNGYPVIIGLEQ